MPTKESISMALCEGRVAVVTGRGGGLRRAFCLMLAAEDAKVVVNDMGSAANGDGADATPAQQVAEMARRGKIGRASCRERVCQYVEISVVAVSLKKKKKYISNINRST